MRKLLPTTYFFIYLALLLILDWFFPGLPMIKPPYHFFIGLPLVFFGISFNLWAGRLFKEKKTTVKPFQRPSALVVEGPFRFTRHPMYLGFVSILLGLAFVLNNAVTLLLPMAMLMTMQILFVSREEQTLEEIFGDDYRHYKKRVRRWL